MASAGNGSRSAASRTPRRVRASGQGGSEATPERWPQVAQEVDRFASNTPPAPRWATRRVRQAEEAPEFKASPVRTATGWNAPPSTPVGGRPATPMPPDAAPSLSTLVMAQRTVRRVPARSWSRLEVPEAWNDDEPPGSQDVLAEAERDGDAMQARVQEAGPLLGTPIISLCSSELSQNSQAWASPVSESLWWVPEDSEAEIAVHSPASASPTLLRKLKRCRLA